MQRNVKWVFNPPKASHHGGVWERCICTVRKVLNAITEQIVDDERLSTLMFEVEAIVNSRQLRKYRTIPKISKPSPQITCCCSGKDPISPLAYLPTTIIIHVANGDRYNTLLICFGNVGQGNMYRACKNDSDGVKFRGILPWETLSFSLTKVHPATPGHWAK